MMSDRAFTMFLETRDPTRFRGYEKQLAVAAVGKPVPWLEPVRPDLVVSPLVEFEIAAYARRKRA